MKENKGSYSSESTKVKFGEAKPKKKPVNEKVFGKKKPSTDALMSYRKKKYGI